jgi:outer membrane protein assembly factor BamB
MARSTRRRRLLLACALVWGLLTLVTTSASAQIVTQDSDSLRTGWYPNQPALTPQTVSSERFGRIFDHRIQGQVYAQPLVANGVLFVATSSDVIYGFDPQTGDLLWERSVGPPVESSGGPTGGCPNPSPHIGVLGTPVIDGDANTAYFIAKGYVAGDAGAGAPTRFQLHAVDLADGSERSGFPVEIAGSAQNLPGIPFDPEYHLQRPGLLLTDGTIYAGFGGICDSSPFYGWLAAISTSGQMKGMWLASSAGASIWQSGGALASDGPGQVIFSTGNSSTFDGGGAPPPGPGRQPPAQLGESVVRVDARPDGTMQATDFFSPWNNVALDEADADLSSSSPMALPEQWFGTPSVPRLLLQDGKEGYLYVLDRDQLGGMGQGPDGHDQVVQRLGPDGGVWDAMAAWPGDGGFVYVTTVVTEVIGTGALHAYAYGVENGRPRLSLTAASDDAFAYGSGSPIVTSDGLRPGSGIVWGTRCPSGRCLDAELRAYAATPHDGHLELLLSSPIGIANKFTAPGVGDGRIFVGTRDGRIVGYGPVPALAGPDVSFGMTAVSRTGRREATFTALEDMTVTDVRLEDARFGADLSALSLPLQLRAGESFSLPLTFTPSGEGAVAAPLTIVTANGTRAFLLSGRGAMPTLSPSMSSLEFEPILVGTERSATVSLTNTGEVPVTTRSVATPGGPFHVTGAPAPGSVLEPGAATDLHVTFHPTADGTFSGSIDVQTEVGATAIPVTGVGLSEPLERAAVAFPATLVGQVAHRGVTLTATRDITIRSLGDVTPPFSVDSVSTALPVDLRAGESIAADLVFTPTRVGPSTGRLTVGTSDLPMSVELSGRGGTATLEASSTAIDLGEVAAGGSARRSVSFTAAGDTPLTLRAAHRPAPPFGVDGVPPDGTTLAPGEHFAVTLDFAPLLPGSFSGELVLDTLAGPARVSVTGTGTVPDVAARPLPALSARPELRSLRIGSVRLMRDGRRVARVRYRLSAAATVTVGLTRLLARRDCRGRPRACTRSRHLAWQRTLAGDAGLNRARLLLPPLPPGHYALLAAPAGSDGAVGAARSAPFQVLAPP